MKETELMPIDRYGYDFIPPEFLPPGKDEYWLRDTQQTGAGNWRNLRPHEIDILTANANRCSDWSDFLVTDPFEPELIYRCAFYGRVRLGVLRNIILKHHDFSVQAGIRDSTIISCDIGDDCAIQNCALISHYIIGDRCILFRIDEMQATNHAKFGNGALKDGEDEELRIWIDVINEAGGRSVLPFAEMTIADAFLWAAFRDDTALTERFREITQRQYGGKRGSYGTVGPDSVIKSCRIIKDTAVGSCAYIKGANKLKNITILSSGDESTQIGEGVELVNGIVGYGCRVFYGCKAVRFVMGRNCGLKYGARLIHSVLGDNSTVSCCEILNNLIFPVHEQHHNNSFLIAGLIQGQSNMAAAATIGSNHNSRANDGEIHAGRGFWPGLAVSLKHSSRFASYTLIVKGNYPAELNIPFPFSLVNNNTRKNRLEVLPAYFWLYNLYALERNAWKACNRGRWSQDTGGKNAIRPVETDYLAPDTAEEILSAISLLETWLGTDGNQEGRAIPACGLERGKRTQVILRPAKAIAAYRQMLRYYAVKTIAVFFDSRGEIDFDGLCTLLGPADPNRRVKDWVNCGGQIVPGFRVDRLRGQIRAGELDTWQDIHAVYDDWYAEYPLDKARHAWSVRALLGDATAAVFKQELLDALETRQWLGRQVYETRAKDFRDPFTQAVFRSRSEMERVVGTPETNTFVKLAADETARFTAMIHRIVARLAY